MTSRLALVVIIAAALALHCWPAEAGIALGVGILAGCGWAWLQRRDWPR